MRLLAIAIAVSTVTAATHAEPVRIELDNGAVALLTPIEGSQAVAVQACYRAGIIDDPAGMPHVTHLLEHLQITSAIGDLPAGAQSDILSRAGMINAETLGDFIHYDYALPADMLAEALGAERDRLTKLTIERENLRQEAFKASSEVGFVEGSPGKPLGKFAFMAAVQAWKGQDEALLKTGLTATSIDEIEMLRAQTHHPGRLLLSIVGGFDPAEAEQMLRDTIGAIEAGETGPDSIDYAALDPEMTIQWDPRATAVVIAYPPPEDPAERIALSLYGQGLMMRLQGNEALQRDVASYLTSALAWPVGRLPYFVIAILEPGADPAAVAEQIDTIMRDPAEDGITMQLQSFALQLATRPRFTQQGLQSHIDMVAQMRQLEPAAAERMVLADVALQLAVRELLLGENPDLAADAAGLLSIDRRAELLGALDPESRFITILKPRPETGEPQPAQP
ncbi:MAG: M16 family metallopeptidase [Phycisphaerales bacterium JB039]